MVLAEEVEIYTEDTNNRICWCIECAGYKRQYKFDSQVVDLSNWINHLINIKTGLIRCHFLRW